MSRNYDRQMAEAGAWVEVDLRETDLGLGRSKGNGRKQDNGLTATHYELPKDATELKHLIWYKDMNAQIGEAFRALYRLDDCAHSTRKRDLNKAKAYIDQELERMEKYMQT